MNRLSGLIAALLCAGIFCLAQARPGPDSNYNISVSAGASYSGPGDVVSGFSAWWSCARAYNAAYATGSNHACDIVDTATGAASCTMNIAANGFADVTSLSCVGGTVSVTTFCTVTHPAGCSVTKMYDQTGNGVHITQATLADMPTLNLTAKNSLPCPVFNETTGQTLTNATGLTTAQPVTTSVVLFHVGGGALAANTFIDRASNALSFFTGTSANTLTTFAGSANQSVTVTDNAWHAIQDVWDEANSLSAIYSDGTNTSINGIGTSSLSGQVWVSTSNGTSFPYNGTICEEGVNGVSMNSTQKSNMNSNQHGANGYNF